MNELDLRQTDLNQTRNARIALVSTRNSPLTLGDLIFVLHGHFCLGFLHPIVALCFNVGLLDGMIEGITGSQVNFRARVNVIQLGAPSALAHEYVALDPPWENLGELVFCMGSSRHSKHIVQFFEGPLHCLRQEEEDQNQGNNVETGIKTEGSLGCKGPKHVRERK